MSSFRQIEANRRNAQLSTGPATADGKRRSRKNAIRHGLTAETVINSLEDAEDYADFEMKIRAEYDPQSVLETELVLRLASLLWRLRRATMIESGLFKIQALQLLQFRQSRQAQCRRQDVIDRMCGNAVLTKEPVEQSQTEPDSSYGHSPSGSEPNGPTDDLTRSFVRLCNLATFPLDRLARYEATLWRQAYQILFALQSLSVRKPR